MYSWIDEGTKSWNYFMFRDINTSWHTQRWIPWVHINCELLLLDVVCSGNNFITKLFIFVFWCLRGVLQPGPELPLPPFLYSCKVRQSQIRLHRLNFLNNALAPVVWIWGKLAITCIFIFVMFIIIDLHTGKAPTCCLSPEIQSMKKLGRRIFL